MPKIQRKTQKIFCSNAENDQLAVFGSMVTGNPVYTNDIETLQSNEAYTQGWEAATEEDKAPFMEEMNGLQYGLSKQIAYTFQEGIPEYDANTTYYIGSIVKKLNAENKPVLYTSIIDNNTDNALTDTTSWEELKLGGVSEEELINALSNKVDLDLSNCTKPYVVEVSDKSLLPSWYRIYSDGWCEQGCREVEYGSTAKTITYLIPFSSLPSLIVRPFKNSYDTSNVTRRNFGYEDTVEGFTVRAGETTLLGWEAKGYIS